MLYSLHDPHFFKKLFDDCYKELVIYANGYLFDLSRSEDVVQEVFIKLWEKARHVKIKTSVKAYLYSMVKNTCLNELKKNNITDHYNLLEINMVPDSESDETYLIAERETQVCDQIFEIVDTFPSRMREIFKLKYFNNYKYAEIADELGISVNTVKIQLKRAKLKIHGSVTSTLSGSLPEAGIRKENPLIF